METKNEKTKMETGTKRKWKQYNPEAYAYKRVMERMIHLEEKLIGAEFRLSESEQENAELKEMLEQAIKERNDCIREMQNTLNELREFFGGSAKEVK